ncbi:MAG: poly-gamma-glutamate biosynthesis protein PgsC/CapC, partial [Polyangiales bacterium]
LALQPLKALTTVIEAWVLVWSFRLLIQLPGIRGLNLQGPRRLCSMYLLSFALKLLLSWAAQWWWPQLFVSDLFGFGYLLTSLIAVKCVQRGDSARVLIPSVLTAAQGALLGRGLALLLALWLGLDSDTRDHSSPRIRTGPAMARSLLLAATRVRRTPPDAPPAEGQHIVRVLHRWLQDKAQPAETLLSGMPHAIVRQWVQRRDARRCLHLFVPRHGLAPAPGVPSVWLCARRGPVWLVPPDPLAAEVPGWVSAWLADRLPVAAVVMLGAPLPERQGRLGKAPWRAHETLASLRTALSGRPTWILQARPGADSRLVPLSSPALTDVAALRALLPGLQVRFGEVPGALQPVLHADSAWLTFAPTRLAATLPPAPKHNQPTRARLQHIEAQAWRRDDPRPYPLGNSESRLASAAMIQAAASAADRRSASKPLPAAVAFAAQQLGWRAHTHRLDPGQTLWWLDGGVSGQVLLAPGRAGGWQVLAPRAVDEAGTAAIALHAFTTLRARALFIAGSAVPGPALGFGDSLRPVAAHAPLGPLIVRALLRDSPAHAHHPVRTLIVRAQPPERRPVHGIVLTVGEEIPPQLGPELRRALTPALRPWAPPALMQGQAAFAGLATTHHLPDRYLAHTDRSRAVVAWFADALLTEVDGHPEKASVLELLRASHIPVTAPEDPEPKDPGPGAGPAMRPAKGRAARR